MSEDEKKKDVFIQEQIRKKPFYRRKCFQRTVRGTVAIVLLGVSAGGTFAFVQPLALQYRKEKDKMVVVSSETESETAAAEKVTETAAREEDLSNYEQVYIKMAAAADETKKPLLRLRELPVNWIFLTTSERAAAVWQVSLSVRQTRTF